MRRRCRRRWTSWRTSHVTRHTSQVDELADVQAQLEELRVMKLRAEESRLRDFALDADAVAGSGSAADHGMMLKSQQQVRACAKTSKISNPDCPIIQP